MEALRIFKQMDVLGKGVISYHDVSSKSMSHKAPGMGLRSLFYIWPSSWTLPFSLTHGHVCIYIPQTISCTWMWCKMKGCYFEASNTEGVVNWLKTLVFVEKLFDTLAIVLPPLTVFLSLLRYAAYMHARSLRATNDTILESRSASTSHQRRWLFCAESVAWCSPKRTGFGECSVLHTAKCPRRTT